MNKIISILFFTAVFMLLTGPGEAFVPQTPHLLYLMIQKISKPAGMEVHQTRNVMEASGQEASMAAQPIALDERLVYAFPGKFRSEIISGAFSRFYVESASQFVKVADGQIVSQAKSPVDAYTDILLYRDQDVFLEQLAFAGVDTEQVSFQRFEGKICYFIGQPSLKESAGLWIERESLLPVQYVIQKNGWTIAFHYENWQRVSKTWYPMQTRIFVDNQLFTRIDVQAFTLASGFPPALFDVNSIRKKYPVRDRAPEQGQAPGDKMDELDKQIEVFRKLYE